MIIINQSISDLTNDIIIDFARNNNNVIVFTGNDIEDLIIEKNVQYFYGYRYNKRNNLSRLSSWIIFTFQAFFFLLKKRKETKEILLISNPPLLYFLVLIFKKNIFYLLVYDLYPDIIKIKVKYDFFGIIKIWTFFNKSIFNKARLVFTIGEKMKLSIANYTDVNKILVINNWSKLYISNTKNENQLFEEQYNFLANKFIFIYSGNMGATHDFAGVKRLMLDMKNNDYVIFLFLGSGSKYTEISDFVIKHEITNALFLPKLPREEFDYVLSKCSLGIVVLDNQMSTFSVPSKSFSYLSHGVPIINFSSSKSEITSLISIYQIGVNFDINNYSECFKKVNTLIYNSSELDKLKKKSLEISEMNFSPENAKMYLKEINKYRLAENILISN